MILSVSLLSNGQASARQPIRLIARPVRPVDEQTLRLLPLRDELNTIREIVATTIRFVNIPRSEATWNDHVHGPILRLAVSGTQHVGAENITQAAIAKAFIPAARGELETLGGKMIDYALLLRPEPSLAESGEEPTDVVPFFLARAYDRIVRRKARIANHQLLLQQPL